MTKFDDVEEVFHKTSRGAWYSQPYNTYGHWTIYPPCIAVHLAYDGSRRNEKFPDGYVVHPAVAEANAEFIIQMHNKFPAIAEMVKTLRSVKEMLDKHPQAAVGNTVVHVCACKITGALRRLDD